MYESHLTITDQQQQADLFEDLSQFIKIFKKIMNLTHDIMNRLDQQSPITQINQLKQIPLIHKQLAEHYNSKMQENSPNKKLYQALCLYKGNNHHKNQAHVLYKEFLEKSQQTITSFQVQKNVGKMFKKILHLTQRFCQSCEIILNNGFQEEVLNYFSKTQQNQREQQSPNSQKLTRKQIPNRTQSNFHKAMNVLNRRFSTLNCLDLDYNSFKTYYFQSRNQKKELYRQYLQRNAITWKFIHSYSKQFSDYIKKKEKYNMNRKNRFKEKLENAIKNDGQIKDKLNYKTNVQCLRDKELPFLSKNGQRQTSPQKKIDFNHLFKDGDPRKTQYQIKNIYLTLNKITNSHISPVYDREPKTMHKKSFKEKSTPYSQFKVSKINMNPPKANEPEKPKYKPLLQIRHLQSKQYGYTLDSNLTQQMTKIQQFTETKYLKGKKVRVSKKSISQKKSIKLSQLLNNKSSIQTKIDNGVQQDESMYQIRVLNCEQEQIPKK